MRITDIKPTTVTTPLDAPLRHSSGCHWGRFVRTIVEVETDEGISGLGEMGGGLREQIPFASYLFFRYPNDKTGAGGEETAAEMVRHAKDLVAKHGFTSHKLKAGVFPPDHEVRVFRALAEAFPNHRLRIDP